jgi:hypothetical protein
VAEKTAAPVTEVQLGFAFLSDAEPSSATPAPAAASHARAPRAGGKPRGLAETKPATSGGRKAKKKMMNDE